MKLQALTLSLVLISLTDALPYVGRPSREILQVPESVDIGPAAPAEQAAALSDFWEVLIGKDENDASVDGEHMHHEAVESENATTMSIVMNSTEVNTTSMMSEEKATTTTFASMEDVPTNKKGIDIVLADPATTTFTPSSTLLNLIMATSTESKTSAPIAARMTTPEALLTVEPTVSLASMLAHSGDFANETTSTTTSTTMKPTSPSTTAKPKTTAASTTAALPSGATSLPSQPIKLEDGSGNGNAASAMAASSLLAIVAALCFCL